MSGLLWMHDPRLKPLALSPLPVWLWSQDAHRVLWTNPVGAAIFGAPSPTALADRVFDAGQPTAAQVERLSVTLPADGTTRLEQLRGFGAGIGRTLACSCSRLELADGTPAVLIVATEPSARALPLQERATRVLAGVEDARAVYADDGALIHATPAALARLGDTTSLATNANVELPTPPVDAPEPRRLPLRFVWHMDADGRFTVDSDEFIDLMGPVTAALLGQPWQNIAAAMALEADGLVAAAIATRDTWSGLSVAWPVDGSGERVTVELSGLPVFDRERVFRGYRGFGMCREMERLNALAQARRSTPPPVSPSGNVVPLHPLPAGAEAPGLSPRERHAFYELSRRLAGSINGADAVPDSSPAEMAPTAATAALEVPHDSSAEIGELITPDARPFLDRLPVGVLIYRLSHLLYANAAFLEWTGFDNLDALAEAGGLDCLLIDPAVAIAKGGPKSFSLANPRDATATVDAQLLQVPWPDETAFAVITMPPSAEATARTNAAIEEARAQVDELHAILDTATDGVIVLDRAARVLSANRSAQALFGYDAQELVGRHFDDLFAPESIAVAIDYLDRLQGTGVASLLNDGREIIGRERNGGSIPLFMTIGRLGEKGDKFCAVFRDVTAWKKVEQELTAASREAERASSAKSDFLATISHEIRTPLNAIIGFSEVMMEERFGKIGNERYRQYLKDIHASGGHLISLVNDLLDLSKIEAGKLELTFASVSINDLTQECVAMMQQQASRERIIIRTSLSPKLPQVTADALSVRQIVLNLLSNSIKFTVPGGQVIVSTAVTGTGEIVLRVRDTGIGMSDQDIATALKPFRQVATATRARSGGTGLGLPLTKALAEANHAGFHIKSAPNTGTLVEITFPPERVLAMSHRQE